MGKNTINFPHIFSPIWSIDQLQWDFFSAMGEYPIIDELGQRSQLLTHIAGWLWDSKPIDPTCTVNILPTVRFFYRKAGNIEECLIDMRKTAIEATNAQCIDTVLKHYENIAANKEAYFIWIVHGWKSRPGSKSSTLKDSYFHKYSVNGLVFK